MKKINTYVSAELEKAITTGHIIASILMICMSIVLLLQKNFKFTILINIFKTYLPHILFYMCIILILYFILVTFGLSVEYSKYNIIGFVTGIVLGIVLNSVIFIINHFKYLKFVAFGYDINLLYLIETMLIIFYAISKFIHRSLIKKCIAAYEYAITRNDTKWR